LQTRKVSRLIQTHKLTTNSQTRVMVPITAQSRCHSCISCPSTSPSSPTTSTYTCGPASEVRGSSWLKSSSFNHLWAKLWQRKPLYPPQPPRLQHRPAGGKVRRPSPLSTS